MQLHSVIDALICLREYRAEVARGLKQFQIADEKIGKLLNQAESLMAQFEVCPRCHNTKGVYTRSPTGGNWDDCAQCKGRGFVKK